MMLHASTLDEFSAARLRQKSNQDLLPGLLRRIGLRPLLLFAQEREKIQTILCSRGALK